MTPDKRPFAESAGNCGLSMKDVDDAEARLLRFAPVIMKRFPGTRDQGGLIESPLVSISRMKKLVNEKYGSGISGTLLLKRDSGLGAWAAVL